MIHGGSRYTAIPQISNKPSLLFSQRSMSHSAYNDRGNHTFFFRARLFYNRNEFVEMDNSPDGARRGHNVVLHFDSGLAMWYPIDEFYTRLITERSHQVVVATTSRKYFDQHVSNINARHEW